MRDLGILRTKCMYGLICLMISFFFVSYAAAQNKVVVVPLGSSGTGDATEADVLDGKTFSNSSATGLTGTRPPAPVARSGRSTSYATGDDADLLKGVAWPNPRFTDNNNGTVTDNLTGLVWLKNANCANGTKNWTDSLSFANALYDGWTGDGSGGDCGLSDSSTTGDWRLPNKNELNSLIDVSYVFPALSNAIGTGHWVQGDAFTDVQPDRYWSSTTFCDVLNTAWYVEFFYGPVDNTSWTYSYYMWPVRD